MLLQAQRHEDVWGSVSVTPRVHNFRTRHTRRKPVSGTCRFRVTFIVAGKNRIGRSVNHNVQMDFVDKKRNHYSCRGFEQISQVKQCAV